MTLILKPKAGWRDYISLTKPRVVMLHLITAGTAVFLASDNLPEITLLLSVILGGGLLAAAANVMNCYLDRDIDARMERTYRRPLPAGRIKPQEALLFGGLIAFTGFVILIQYAGFLAAMLAMAAMIYYVLIYTYWLKRTSRWSSLIGSGAGAFPPLIGWIAVTGRLSIVPLLLFLIISLWTISHFWPLAVFRQADYEKAGIPVIPFAKAVFLIRMFTILLVAVTLVLEGAAGFGMVYTLTAVITGAGLVFLAIGPGAKKKQPKLRLLYRYSGIYLAVLFVSMIADKMLL